MTLGLDEEDPGIRRFTTFKDLMRDGNEVVLVDSSTRSQNVAPMLPTNEALFSERHLVTPSGSHSGPGADPPANPAGSDDDLCRSFRDSEQREHVR